MSFTDIPEIQYPDYAAGNLSDKTLRFDRGIYLMESLWRDKSYNINIPLDQYNYYNLHGLEELRDVTTQLHNEVSPYGYELTRRELVFGMGATQCFHAALYALYTLHGIKYITTQLPGYLEYKRLVDTVSPHIQFVTDVNEPELTVEIVCSPNNPDGRLLRKSTDAKYVIHDNINHWPFFFERPEEYYFEDYSNQDISIYSYPKILGFSASRVGHAFVRNKDVAELMRKYIVYSCHGLCTEGQLRCIAGIKHILTNTNGYVTTLINNCQERWRVFTAAVNSYNERHRSKIQLLNNGGPTAWLKMKLNAELWLQQRLNIVGTYGPEYGVDDTYARLNLLAMPNEFNELIRRLDTY